MSMKALYCGSLALLAACGSELTANDAVDPEGIGEQRVCASHSLEGVDVSKYEGTVNWHSVAASGRRFAITRIGDGMGGDVTFNPNWAGIKSAGMYRGAYQFFRPGDDPVAQANIVISKVGHLGPGDLPAILDAEVTDGVSAGTIVSRMKTWLAKVEAGTGKRPLIYTSPGFWPSLNNPDLSKYGLWVANWGVSCPRLPTHWNTWRFWQYSDHGNVPGIGSTDVNRFFGTEAELAAYANGTGTSLTASEEPIQDLPAE